MRTRKNNTDVLNSSPLKYKVSVSKIKKIAQVIRAALGVANHELCISFVKKNEIARLNKSFRNKVGPTDVLSFPQLEFLKALRVDKPLSKKDEKLKNYPLGDIVIALEVAEKNAKKIGQDLDRETCFLLVHGMLHLCGHDHQKVKEEKIMLAEQKLLMDLLLRNGRNNIPLWKRCVTVV